MLSAANIGPNVRRLRLEWGWTQANLASRAGMTANTLARVERRVCSTSLPTAIRLATALHVGLDALCGPLPSGYRPVQDCRTVALKS